jgi:xylulokinase
MTIGFLAIDIGTSSTKGILIDEKANIIAEEKIAHGEISTVPGYHEHDAEIHWWGEFNLIVKRILDQLSLQVDISAVCISGMWPTFCPTDANGIPLCNAILYNDMRSLDITRSIMPILGPFISGYEYLARLIWVRENLQSIWSNTRKVFTTHNYIVYHLTGRYVIDSFTASALGNLLDLERFEWKKDLLKDFGIPLELLPQICPPSTIAGYITQRASKLTGLKSGIPVIVGTGDTLISIIGAGAHLANDGVIYYGSLGLFVRLTKDIRYLLEAKSFKEGEGIQWILSLPESGKQLEWMENLTHSIATLDETSLTRWMNFESLVNLSEAGSSGVLFIHNVQDHGNISIAVSPQAGIIGLTTNTSRADISRSILESFGYAIRKSLEDVKLKPEDFNHIYAAGGGARISLWKNIVSEIIQMPQYFYKSSLGAIGGGILAGHTIGAIDINMISRNRTSDLEPPSNYSEQNPVYDRNYKIYKYYTGIFERKNVETT